MIAKNRRGVAGRLASRAARLGSLFQQRISSRGGRPADGAERVRSAPLRHAPFALFVAGVLAYGAAFAWYMLDRFDLVNLIRDVNGDDSFYYFQIAWRLAQGEFSTFDGLTRTNGYHPLWLLLITPFYWVFDKTEALFAIKAFEIMLVAGGVALVAGAARVARLPWVLLFAALPALYRHITLFGGFEAAAALFLLSLFVLAVCLFARDPARWRWPLAAVAFALPWVRLEYVAVAVAATAALCFIEWSDRFPAGDFPRASRGGWSGWRRPAPALNAAAPLFGAVAGILAYFTWNAAVFGVLVPVSAGIKRMWSLRRWEREGGYSLTENALEYLRWHGGFDGGFDDELLVSLEVCVYAALVWWFSRRSRGRDDWLLLAFLVGVSALAAGHLAKFAQSVLMLDPVEGHVPRYFVPAYLTKAVAVPARCCVAVWFVRRFAGRGRAARPGFPPRGIVAAGAVFLFATTDFTAPFRFVDRTREDVVSPGFTGDAYLGTMVMNRLLPEDSVVGSFDSGVIGYFSRFPVMNLDGLANSRDYLRARREGTAAAFRERHGIAYMAGWWPANHRLYDAMLFEGPKNGVTPEDLPFKLWPAGWNEASWRGVHRSAWFRERMEPHLEPQAGGVGLLVTGRLAQAFVPDCAPDELAAWTWGGRGDDETTFRPWTRTRIGFCASAVVLPHDARPPVRAAAAAVGERLADRIGGRRPAIDADFDVYLVEQRPVRRAPSGGAARRPADPPGGVGAASRRRLLVYVKESCGPDDVDAPFFLHVDAVDPGDLPGPRRRYGFDNLDFRFDVRGTRVGGVCTVEVPLPEYGIAAIRTGQYVEVEGGYHHPWEGEIRLGSDEGGAAAPRPASEPASGPR